MNWQRLIPYLKENPAAVIRHLMKLEEKLHPIPGTIQKDPKRQ